MNTTEFLQYLQDSKIDLKTKDFKVIVGDNVVQATPEMVAEMFCSMGSDEQARFFNHIPAIASTWHGGDGALSMQLQWITDDDGLTLAGRRAMAHIGEYSHWGLSPYADPAFMEKLK